MRKTILCSAFALLAVSASAQQDPVVMTVNGVDVPRSEFEYSFNKNNSDGVIDKKSVDEYVDLFVNYKLKVAAAMDEKLDTLSSFKQEFAMYRDQQVRPTLVTDAEVLAEARKAYDRTKEAIGPRGLILPAHIFLRLSTKATAQEQEKVRQRADSVWRALKAGADFAELAGKVSQMSRTASRGGTIGWMQPNQTYPEFEDAVEYKETRLIDGVLTPCRIIAFKPTGFVMNPVTIGVKSVLKNSDGSFDYDNYIGVSYTDTPYYPIEEKDSSIMVMNYTETDTLKMFFSPERKLEKIWMPAATGTWYPLTQIPPAKLLLPQFVWLEDIRPKDKYDIFAWRGKSEEAKLKVVERHAAPLQSLDDQDISDNTIKKPKTQR